MKKIINKVARLMVWALPVMGMVSCSDDYMAEINKNPTKTETLNPNYLLTTGLLQTYGDFQVMDTWRCYVQGFTQHLSGCWNVCNYAGSNLAADDMMRSMWSRYYSEGIKSLVDAERLSANSPNVNAVIRIHKAYMFAVLTDTYGDVPCFQAGKSYILGIGTPEYDKQEDIYNWLFEELAACIKQIGMDGASDKITGDVTAFNGNLELWKKYANSLRLRYAMRISDVNPEKAKEEWEKAVAEDCGFLDEDEDAYIKYYDGSFNAYDGARDYDFRVNSLSAMNYSQDSKTPALICATLYDMLKKNEDPRLYRICRYYVNGNRAKDKADFVNNIDCTKEVINYQEAKSRNRSWALRPGEAYYSDYITVDNDADWVTFFPELLVKKTEDPKIMGNDSDQRMLHPWLSLKFERGTDNGILMTYAEVEFLKAEAALKGWDVGDTDGAAAHFKKGVKAAMKVLNNLNKFEQNADDQISEIEMNAYVDAHPLNSDIEKAKEQINTEAWILHLTNPMEAWANMRRSDYPAIIDRSSYHISDFTEAEDMSTPTRLKYPHDEVTANAANYNAALVQMQEYTTDRILVGDDWHGLVWWDKKRNTHFISE